MNTPPSTTPSSTTWDLNSHHQRSMLHKDSQGYSFRCSAAVEKDMATMGPLAPQRSDLELLQNCDLPPPLKLFTGDNELLCSSPKAPRPSPPIKKGKRDEEAGKGLIDDTLGLMKALQLSQTRAREAEKKASVTRREKDSIVAMFWEESWHLFAHRQWIKLLELEILKLQSQLGASYSQTLKEQLGEEDDGDPGSTWCIALAFCFGLAGVGFALSYRYCF